MKRLLLSVQSEVFRCFSAAFDQMTGKYSTFDRTSNRTTPIVTEDGTCAEHFLEIAVPFSSWKQCNQSYPTSKVFNLTPINLVLVHRFTS